ncbi:hypothetical protein [Kribbella speibonae]|uniref:Uncharacterized protein n=1 Tax=Kribbella speibonae TaxID=1572660 RepID=A0A4R0IIB3_9ACTN|nr:hypothetical protein [Kribbella speibonae]TCC19441.1 hypothetical protein E0H58_31540 [Kribbella speibonae]TCC31900.1 hypothetical protein E0H92_35870 [Kribbella speibonae]
MLTLRTAPGIVGRPDVRLTRSTPADLVRAVELAPGVAVEIDLADPSRWHAVDVRRWDAADRDLLEALLGPAAVREVTGLLAPGDAKAGVPLEVAPATVWRRLAVVDALDWWLQLPLNQGLLDAERAIVRARAARSLRSGALRRTFVDRAVVLARRSAGEVSTYLNGIAGASLPKALSSGLSRLAAGYASLAREVDGPDAALAAVQTAWERVSLVPLKSAASVAGALPALASSGVDPRRVRARVVGSDVQLVPTGTAVRVVVPAFAPLPSPVVADRLMVRLVDRRSGEAQTPALLTLNTSTAVFTEVVPLRGASVDDLRADVFDADSAEPAASDTDLLRQRRAQLVLSEWRRAAAESRLSRSLRARNRRLTRLLDALAPTTGPLFLGGPAREDISDLVNGSSNHPWFSTTAATGGPLVAELAAAYDHD